ncbi:phage tail domain-containing protein [Schinkia azotoformans]|uniref:phage tail domain-containing protein n=1 Tax=Schinkia azotoformans TaxID=1454 RepID=UPI002DBEA2D8|nr:phage tail domain-containing protein [Schinkia azotoformans]MEC1780080.1 phage tail family protein [Schinkia azotoformans]MED4330841.1 phage tail family protein [Schinkia azotoformans]
MHSEYFSYDGVRSTEIDVYLVKLDKGLVSDPFLGEREVIQESITGNDTPYFFGTRTSQLRVTLTLECREGYWTREKRREVARLLDKKKYCEFYTTDDIDTLYFLQYVGGIDLYTNAIQDGYLTVEFLNISPYTYSRLYAKNYNFSTNTTPDVFEFTNLGDNPLYPEIWIEKIGAGDVSIINLSNGGKEFKFTGLADKEQVYVDNRPHFHYIESSLNNIYRYDNFSGNYLEILRGVNRLQITGQCNLLFQYQFELKG